MIYTIWRIVMYSELDWATAAMQVNLKLSGVMMRKAEGSHSLRSKPYQAYIHINRVCAHVPAVTLIYGV